jgi:DNA polymerase-3 subunit beta
MKLSIKRDQLNRILSAASGAVSSSAALPILQNALLTAVDGGLVATGSNLDLSIAAKAEAVVEEPGQVAINAKKLAGIVSRIPSAVLEIESDNKYGITISAGKSNYHINGLDPDTFAPVVAPPNAIEIKLEQPVLKGLIESCEYAISRDASRYALLGLLFAIKDGEMTVAGSDGRRLAIKSVKVKVKADHRFTVPHKSVTEVRGLFGGAGDVRMLVGEGKLLIKSEDITLITKLIDTPFPEISQMIPKTTKVSSKADRKELAEAAGRAALFASEKTPAVNVKFTKKTIEVTAKSAEYGDAKDEIAAKTEGGTVEIAVNPRYFIEALENSNEKEIAVEINEDVMPFKVSDATGYCCVIAPLLKQ